MGREEDTTVDANQEPTSLNTISSNASASLHTVSSQLASATSTCVFYPFDTLKTRYMSQDGTRVRQHNGHVYSSIRGALALIYKEEGLRPLFRGCTTAIAGTTIAWGTYMFLYRQLCKVSEITSYLGRSFVSLLSSVVSSYVTCPIFLVKCRMQLEEANRSSHYRSFWAGVRHTVETSGVRSLWRGISLQLLLVVPNALAIPTYDSLKGRLLRYRRDNGPTTELNLLEISVCSTITKVWILILSHPLIMMRVRMQDERALLGQYKYHTILQSISNVLKTQGPLGMYRGFSTAFIHSLPRSLLHYCIYEKSLSLLCKQYPPH